MFIIRVVGRHKKWSGKICEIKIKTYCLFLLLNCVPNIMTVGTHNIVNTIHLCTGGYFPKSIDDDA